MTEDELLLEQAHGLNDLILYSAETKRLYTTLLALLEAEKGRAMVLGYEEDRVPLFDERGVLVGTRPETTDERMSRYYRTCGYIEGLDRLGLSVQRLQEIAEEDNAGQ